MYIVVINDKDIYLGITRSLLFLVFFMKLFIYTITLSILLCAVASQPVSDTTTLIKKLKLQRKSFPLSLSKRGISTPKKLKETGYFHGSGKKLKFKIY
jgi:hypothetical protein